MRQVVHNLRDSRLREVLVFALPTTLVTVGLMGITTRGDGANAAGMELERARAQVEEREDRVLALRELGSAERLALAEELRAELRGLIPRRLERVEVFDLVRMAAARADVSLGAVELADEIDLRLVVDDQTVAERRLHVVGQGTLEAFVTLIRDLRSAGVPTAVHEFSVSRDDPRGSVFRIDARLGVFYYTAPSAPDPTEPEDDGS